MPKIHTIDLLFQEENHSIAAYLVESEKGPILIEVGPMTTFQHLKDGIQSVGYKVEDIQHVFLTHIHFDHAGAAWKFAEHGANIYVHPIGLPHLHQPEKLWNSAAQIYGDDMDRLWGEMKPIPQDQLISADDGNSFDFEDFKIKVIYTPGHAVHHNAYQIDDVIFTGDVGGVKIDNGPIVPPCPPPDINLDEWKNSIKKLKSLRPSALYLTHYGCQEQPEKVLNDLERILDDWANFIKPHYDKKTPVEVIIPEFIRYTQDQLRAKNVGEELIKTYEYANPSWMSVNGLLRYWKLKEQGRI